jgi:hypothetical protein
MTTLQPLFQLLITSTIKLSAEDYLRIRLHIAEKLSDSLEDKMKYRVGWLERLKIMSNAKRNLPLYTKRNARYWVAQKK